VSEENGNDYLSPFIPDGWTLKATIPAVEGHWSAVTIRYRPICADEEKEIFAKSQMFPGTPLTAFYAPVMASKIVGWDIKDPSGGKLEVTEQNIKRLSPQFYDMLRNYVDGTATGEQEKN
jgi:hypothetical protein